MHFPFDSHRNTCIPVDVLRRRGEIEIASERARGRRTKGEGEPSIRLSTRARSNADCAPTTEGRHSCTIMAFTTKLHLAHKMN